MDTFTDLISNRVLISAVVAWFTAQVLKALLTLISTKKFELERLFGAGGMPSAHSASVCALVIATARTVGAESPVFALSVIMAVVVMYDAVGVRRAAGRHAKAIKEVRSRLEINEDKDGKELKESLGHTPFEVLGGALLGILIAMIF